MLVSIGIPTYNRAPTLRRALASALAQTHDELEVLVSDNASADGTEELCRAVAADDPRVRYVRQPRNLGPTANFNSLFASVRGDYVGLLADDDWLDPCYVAACLQALRADPHAALVAGRPRYVRAGQFAFDGVAHRHRGGDPAARVRAYLASVDDNGVFYGLMPRAVLDRVRPLPNVLGNDWLHVARIAHLGTIETLDDVRVNRELGGTSADIGSILATFGTSAPWQERVPQLVIAAQLLRDIGWGHPVYGDLGPSRRLSLAVTAALTSIRWPDLAWHLVTPGVASLAHRRRGRAVWAAYDRLTRGLGAGQQYP